MNEFLAILFAPSVLAILVIPVVRQVIIHAGRKADPTRMNDREIQILTAHVDAFGSVYHTKPIILTFEDETMEQYVRRERTTL